MCSLFSPLLSETRNCWQLIGLPQISAKSITRIYRRETRNFASPSQGCPNFFPNILFYWYLLCGKLYIGFKITFLSFLHRGVTPWTPPAIPQTVLRLPKPYVSYTTSIQKKLQLFRIFCIHEIQPCSPNLERQS